MDRVDVHPRILAALKKAKVSDVGYLLTLSAPDLQRLTKLSLNDVTNLQAAIADSIPRTCCVTGLQLLHRQCPVEIQRAFLTTGCPVVDRFLRGGVLSPGLTEIAGESASGKTQFCLQLCLTVQLPSNLGGLDSGAVYICTEDTFPNRRLVQMATLMQERSAGWQHGTGITLTDQVYVEHASDWDDLMRCVSHKVRALLAAGRVRLVVIDSVAGLFRGELDGDQQPPVASKTSDFFTKRARKLGSLASLLHRLSFQFKASIVVVNQVSDVMNSTPSANVLNRPSMGKIPALGMNWSNMLTVRLMMSRTAQSVILPLDETHARKCDRLPESSPSGSAMRTYEATVRAIEVIFAPHLPNSMCQIILDRDGVKGRA